MKQIFRTKRALHFATAVIWIGVLLGASFVTEAAPGRNLDWELLWVIVGGFLLQSALINVYIKQNTSESSKKTVD